MLSVARNRIGGVAVGIVLAAAIGFAQDPPRTTPTAVQASSEAPSAKNWLTDRGAIESFIRTAPAVATQDLKTGATRSKKVRLSPGGPVEYIAWKQIPPGRSSGYWESYRSEIAAYEMDKLLGLDMVPPTVERVVDGERGAAVLWCSPTRSFRQLNGVPTPPPRLAAAWTRQLVRAKMFDNLIGNLDPNLGNWLVDPAWNLVLIDHSRAFTTGKDLPHKVMQNWDEELWTRMRALTPDALRTTIQPLIGKSAVKAIFARRDRMQGVYVKLIAEKGPSAILK